MPTKLRILYLITQDDLGGAAKYILSLAEAFGHQAKISIALGPDGDGWLSKEAAKRGIEVIRLKHLRRSIRPADDLRAIQSLRNILRSGSWDIVHANSSKAGVLMSLSARLIRTRTPIIYTAHGWVFREPLPYPRRAFYLFSEWLAARGRAGTIVLSESEEQIARRLLGIKKSRLYRIAHGLPPLLAPMLSPEEAKKILGLTDQSLVVGAIANFYRTKGLDILLEAAGHPLLARHQFILLIIGDGPERKNLEALRKNHPRRDRIIFAGSIPEAERLLGAFDIFVLPSRKEGLPYALLEALRAGLPIIASDVGAVSETLGQAGMIVRANSAPMLAEALEKLIINKNLRQSLAESAARRALELAGRGQEMIEKTWQTYLNLISGQ